MTAIQGRDHDSISAAAERLRLCLGSVPLRWILVSVRGQSLFLLESGAAQAEYRVSTASAGINGREGSGGIPPGNHRIARKIGDGAPLGTVFDSREPTGEMWEPGGDDEKHDLVLSRILTLEGLEDGINRGPGCDSLARYIYIHGTNHESRIGTPDSQGCIRMTNNDVIDLFERVEEGDPVVIL